MAWLRTISRSEAVGELAEVYAAMSNRPTPPVYRPQHGGIAGIIRTHSLDPRLMQRTFGASGGLHGTTLAWRDRELLAAATSRTNQCFY